MNEEVNERFGRVFDEIIGGDDPPNPRLVHEVAALLKAVRFAQTRLEDQIAYEFFWRDQKYADQYHDVKDLLAEYFQKTIAVTDVLRVRGFFGDPDEASAPEQADAAGA